MSVRVVFEQKYAGGPVVMELHKDGCVIAAGAPSLFGAVRWLVKRLWGNTVITSKRGGKQQ